MRRKGFLMVAAAAALLLAPAALASSTSGLWIHVWVEERGDNIRVNVPLSLIESVLPLIDADELQGGKIRLGALDMDEFDGIDPRELWQAIEDAGDAEYVTITGHDENVRVFREGDFIQVAVEKHHGDETVAVRIPVQVVEALFSGEPGELDLLAAVRALAEYGEGDLIHVQDGRTSVRVWIDASNTGD